MGSHWRVWKFLLLQRLPHTGEYVGFLVKNSLFVGNPRGGRTAAILASLTSTCRRHEIDRSFTSHNYW